MWNECAAPITDLSENIFNHVEIPFAIATCIKIMRNNMNNKDLLRSRPNLQEYNPIIIQMNREKLNDPNPKFTDLGASLFVREFLSYLPDPLLPRLLPSIEVTEPAIVVDELCKLDLSERHLKLFVYIFKFLYDYWKKMAIEMTPPNVDKTVRDSKSYEALDGIARAMVPWMFTPIVTNTGKMKKKEQDDDYLIIDNGGPKRQSKQGGSVDRFLFRFVVGNFEEIFTQLNSRKSDFRLGTVYAFYLAQRVN